MKNGKYIDEYGDEYWYRNGKCHRDDGPAVIYKNGAKYWYQNGKCHREDGPAVIWINGTEFWYQNDKRHRDNGPAIAWADGSEYWYQNGTELTESEFLIYREGIEFDEMMKDLLSGGDSV